MLVKAENYDPKAMETADSEINITLNSIPWLVAVT